MPQCEDFFLKNLVFVQSHWAFISGRFQSGVGMKSIICGMWKFRSRNNLFTVQIALWGPAIWRFFYEKLKNSEVICFCIHIWACQVLTKGVTLFGSHFGSKLTPELDIFNQFVTHFVFTKEVNSTIFPCLKANIFGSFFGQNYTTKWTFQLF